MVGMLLIEDTFRPTVFISECCSYIQRNRYNTYTLMVICDLNLKMCNY